MDYTMEDYRKSVEFCAKKHLDNMLHNEGNEHALIIFENLFKYSQKHVRIVAKDLANNEVVNTKEYVGAMKSFIEKPGILLDILLTNFNKEVAFIEDDVNLFYLLANSKAYKEGRVRIKSLNGKSFKANNKTVHFCTSDGHAYRLERDIERRIAHGNFGDTSFTSTLDNLFDNAFNSDFVNEVKLDMFN